MRALQQTWAQYNSKLAAALYYKLTTLEYDITITSTTRAQKQIVIQSLNVTALGLGPNTTTQRLLIYQLELYSESLQTDK